MRTSSGWPAMGSLVVAFGLAGCGHDGGTAKLLAPGADGIGPVARARASAPAFDPAAFVAGVDHRFLPLVPGTVHTYVGATEEGEERIVVEVLHEPKTILGVAATVVRDRVYLDGELVEDTHDWFAQDRSGNVWYLGEEVRNYEDGVFANADGSWEAGRDGATAGILMGADPRIGDVYQQEHAEGVAEDMARVVSLKKTVSVPAGTYHGCLQTAEWTPLEPGAREFKFYAPGVGLVLEVAPRGGRERVELVSVSVP